MRFLKAAYATFVYGEEVNWVAEVQVRHTKRLAMAIRNPRKLRPVALRYQVQGLYKIIANLANRLLAHCRMSRSVYAAQKEVDAARVAKALVGKALRPIKRKHADAMELMAVHSNEEYARLEAESNAANLEQKRLFCEGMPSEYKAQVEVARTLSEQLTEMQEA